MSFIRFRIFKYIALAIAVLFVAAALFCAYVAAYPPQGIPILEYHMVDTHEDADSHLYNVPPDEFAAQLDYLQREGYTTITLMDFLRAKKGKQQLPDKPIILTFDDGYKDNYTVLLPMLEERGMTAVVFMATNMIGLPDYLTWDELRDMSQRGIEIGSHTANHQPLTTFTPEEQQDEVHLSKLMLEWNGLPTVFSFSYPNGMYDDTMPALLQQNEYLAAVTGDAGLNTFDTDPYLLQRINIPHPKFGLLEFRLRLLKAQIFTKLGIHQHIEKKA